VSGLAALANATALPAVEPPTTLATLTSTDASGSVHTTTSTASGIPTALLGKPAGLFNDASPTRLKVLDGTLRWLWTLTTMLVVWICDI
jgi:hypothetical protein